jgi:GT2 family glycosyltransferase
MEIIFVDDGSEDQTLAVIKDCISKIAIRARVFHQEWKGVGSARNVIVNNSNGKYILWLDTDQALSKDYVQTHIKFMEEHTDTGICFGLLSLPSQNTATPLYLDLVKTKINRESKSILEWIGTGSATYRVKAIKQVKGFNEKLIGAAEDVDVNIRMLKSGWSIRLAGGSVYETHNNMSSWIEYWKRYFVQGTHFYKIYNKRIVPMSLFKASPIIGFLAGLLDMNIAYKLLYKKIVFMLPISYFIRQSAWYLGFTRRTAAS